MKRSLNRFLWVGLMLVSLLMLSSCSQRMMPVNQLRRLSNNIEVKGDSYDLKDWNKAKNKYVKANQKILKHRTEYTAEEAAEIALLQGKCITGFGKGIAASSMRGVAAMGAGVKSLIDEIKELIDQFGKKKDD